MPAILFAAPDRHWPRYNDALRQALAERDIDATLAQALPPENVDYIIYGPGGPVSDFSPFTRCKAVLNLWAGVESIAPNPTLTQPLARMVDPAMTRSMTEWVTAHVLRHHLDIDRHILGQNGVWAPHSSPLATERRVTVLGLGELGQASAITLAALGFVVTGWSRNARQVDGIRCLSGVDGLTEALTGTEIVVTLIPLTPDTENTLNAATLNLTAPGAAIINPGRGALIDDAALLAALDSGQIGHATLDVFRTEPLPQDHPYWAHPRVTVTPHIAAETRPATASRVIAENVRRSEAGEPLLHLVDRSRGY